ncbi:glycosyltransferase family 4 protein [Xanthomonas maliensis]|uniref:glycosyltransferase family 4 protein n=1 Tax=Xanthomonas maliensis TaxID=1321368 RepID=UPI0003AA27AB|nr:glycosyltransferase family 4 protein [Xanthomonas maliensis]KAB7768831.1 glycosyl transferase family 1 [Xanthomonas maliensis]
MRILHVYKDFAPHGGGGGVARHIHGLAVTLAQAGHTLRIVAPQADDRVSPHGYAVARAQAWQLWRHVGWAELVHVHGARTPIAALAAAMAWWRGKRLIYTPHCYYDDDRALSKRVRKWAWDQAVERPLLHSAQPTVLLSSYWLAYLQRRRLAPGMPRVLPNAVLAGEQSAPPHGAQPLCGTPVLLSVGRLDEVKRLHDAIAALTVAGMESAALHIIGRGPDQPRLQACAAAYGVAARVHFHGFVADAEVAAMAARADAFVLPSAIEGMPTVLIEMLLLGCPVVASDIPGNRAILAPLGLQAAMHPLGDSAALAACVAAQRGRRIGPDIVAQVQAGFTWEGLRARVLALYDTQRSEESSP